MKDKTLKQNKVSPHLRLAVAQLTVARCAVLPRRRWVRINTWVILSPTGRRI